MSISGHTYQKKRLMVNEKIFLAQSNFSSGLPVNFIVFPGEGHGIEDLRKSVAIYAVIEKFLTKQLGGRVEPIGEEIEDLSMQWRGKSGAGGMINK